MAGYPTKIIVEDGITVNFLSQNFIEDKLTQTENEQVRLILEKIVGKDIDRNKAIAIHLYKKNDKKLQHDIKYKRYWRSIKRNPNRIEGYLIVSKDSSIKQNPEKDVYIDSYNFFRSEEHTSELQYVRISYAVF